MVGGGGGGRAPCCDKSKVKRGPWSPAEDMRLISFIQMNGHPNWRSLPKQAGLLRCGKSCRLRWINYLRPDVKRGNFTPEEEETIIKLHTSLGNRWSKIASHLPGRTDNEIKNVWNTHLKKRSEGMKNRNGNKITNKGEGEASSSSSSCCSEEQNSNLDHLHQHQQQQQQHSSLSGMNQEIILSSSNTSSSTNSCGAGDEKMIEDFMYDHDPQGKLEEEEEGMIEIPSLEECDIDMWGMLGDLDEELGKMPIVDQSTINQELEGDVDYTKWLKYFEDELELAADQATILPTDQQFQPSCCNLGDFALWPDSSPHHYFSF